MKTFVSLFLVLAFCMSFAACAKQDTATTTAPATTVDTTPKEPADLTGKTIIWNGDSICAGKAETGNWATRIAERNSMEFKNFSAHGGTIADGLPLTQSGSARHCVLNTVTKMYEDCPDADYIIFEGGTNDADLLGNASSSTSKIGTVDPDDFGGSYRVNTFCGALESVFYMAKKQWPDKKIGFVIAQKMGDPREPIFANRRAYFDKAIEICEKWDIPYIDLWNDSELDPSNIAMYNVTKTPEENMNENVGYYLDGQHLTAKGYDVTAELIEAWLKTI